ncbi:hypothetical protein MB02_07875 [Croceicoccus estronivorus]|uniref:PAS domain-containing sensor histidine kinase n=1 Tax=Croceicoccus estronivorus TaxID=1172626 RepID=UPI000830E78E|nr:PAS domain-containing protein [Croceicoccus estronivorus]OCC24175.1 hypothetical protein MB02_07875 [Croceicoccus estronivorus]
MRFEDCRGVCVERIRKLRWDTREAALSSTALHLSIQILVRSVAPKVILWGRDFTTYYNDNVMGLFEDDSGDGIGMPFPEFRPKIWERIRDQVRLAFEGVPCGSSDVALRTGNIPGQIVYYQFCYTPIPGEGGLPAGVLIDIQDVTRVRRDSEILRIENHRLNRLFAEAPVFFSLAVGPEFRIVYANNALERLLGGRPLIGMTVADAVPEMEEQGFLDILRQVYESGRPWVGSDVEMTLRHPETREEALRYVDFVFQPVHLGYGSEPGVIAVGYDVTARHMAEIDAEQLRRQLLHASRINAMDTMAMTVAHELNQPLAAVSNYIAAASSLLNESNANAGRLLKAAADEVERAGDVIRRMRSLVRSGRANRARVSLHSVFVRAVRLIEATEHHDVVFTLDLGEGASHVMADEVQLEQVMVNLFRNAIHASRESERKEVILRSEPLDGCERIAVTVRDFGHGFGPEELDHPFDRVGQSEGGGLGLGLPLTRTIIEANGGTIVVANASPCGAIFTLVMDRSEMPTEEE